MKKHTVKSVIILGIIALIMFILGLFIWLILPGPEATLTELFPREAFAYVSLRLNLNDSGVSDLVNNLRLITNNPDVRTKERFLIKFVIPFFLPMEVATTAILNPDTKNTNYLILLKNNGLARLFRLFALLKLKPIKGHICAIFKDVIIVSKQFLLVEMGLNSYNKRAVFLSNEIDDHWRLRNSEDGVLFINNLDSNFSQFIKNLERKNAYFIFPTVDSIKWIGGYLDILNSNKVRGSLKFKYEEGTDVAEVRKDIDFFAKILQRFFKAEGLNFTREMINHSDSIDLNFEISGLRTLMVSLLSQKGGNNEYKR